MKKQNKPLAEKEQQDDFGNKLFWEDDVEQAVKEAYEELHYNICEKEAFISFSEEAFNRDIKQVFKDKFGFDLS